MSSSFYKWLKFTLYVQSENNNQNKTINVILLIKFNYNKIIITIKSIWDVYVQRPIHNDNSIYMLQILTYQLSVDVQKPLISQCISDILFDYEEY